MNTAEKVAVARKPRARKQVAGPSPEDKALGEKLLAAPTIPDKAWAPARGASRKRGRVAVGVHPPRPARRGFVIWLNAACRRCGSDFKVRAASHLRPQCPECRSFDVATWRDDEDQTSLFSKDDPCPTS